MNASVLTNSFANVQNTQSLSYPLFLLLSAGLFLASGSAFSQDWVPVKEEPRHRLVFENDQAYILEVNLPPGYVSLYHEHKLNLLYITVSGSTVWAQPLGGDKRQVEVETGNLRFSSDNHGLPHIHRVSNVGETPFHLIGVGNKMAINGSAIPLEGDTARMQLDTEKDHALVYRIKLQPGEKSGLHQHNLPFTNVFMAGGTLAGESGGNYTVKPAEYLWHDAGVSHSYENTGDAPIEIIEMLWR